MSFVLVVIPSASAATWRLAIDAINALIGLGESVVSWITAAAEALGITTSTKDIDLHSYDLTNVDRIFFKSNDAIDKTSLIPHISAYDSALASAFRARAMTFFVPNGGDYRFFGPQNVTGGRTVITEWLSMDLSKAIFGIPLQTNKGFSILGTDTSSDDGSMWLGPLVNNKRSVMVRSGGNTYSMSNIGSGGGTTPVTPVVTPFTSNPPTGSVVIPVFVKPATVNQTIMDGLFGSKSGCIGVLAPATEPSGSNIGQVLFCFKGNNKWFSCDFEGRRAASSSGKTGKRFSALKNTYTKKRLTYVISTSGFTATRSDISLPTNGWGIWYSTSRSIADFVTAPRLEVDGAEAGDYWGLSSTSGDSVTAAPTTIPNADATNASRDSTMGVDDGYVGFVDNLFYVKIYGIWYYVNIDAASR